MSVIDEGKLTEGIVNAKERTEEVLRNAVSNRHDYHRVLLVGTSGSGKTTLLYALLGHELVAVKTNQLVLVPKQTIGTAVVDGGPQSVTFIPNIFCDDKNKIIFCDCPGFLDTDPLKRIINAFVIDKLFTGAQYISILVVASTDTFDSDRGQTVNDVLQSVKELIPEREQREKCTGIVVSRIDPEFEPCGFLEELAESDHAELLDHFLKESNRDEIVFSFPEPEEEGEYDLFSDRERMITFFKKNCVSNPKHRVTLSDGETKPLILLTRKFESDFKDDIISFSNAIEKQFSTEGDANKLKRYRVSVNSLIGCKGFESFRTIVESQEQFSECVELKLKAGIEKVRSWIEFTEHLTVANKADESLITFRFPYETIDSIFTTKVKILDQLIESKSHGFRDGIERFIDDGGVKTAVEYIGMTTAIGSVAYLQRGKIQAACDKICDAGRTTISARENNSPSEPKKKPEKEKNDP